MASVPVTIQCNVYPRDKSVPPYPATIVGFASITGLEVGGGPILPPDEVPPVDPPLIIWGGPIDPYPDHGLPIPPLPPVNPPSTTDTVKPNAWNWNDGKNPQYPNVGWYYVYVPAPTDPQPH